MTPITIKEAQEQLKQNIRKGEICPCCKQMVKMYSRKINSGMVLFLIGLYKLTKRNGRQYFSNTFVMHEMNLTATSLDYSVLKHFGLMSENFNTDTKKKKSGEWIITNLGIDFIEGKVSITENVLLYNNRVNGFEGKDIFIKEITDFNYNEL